MINLLGKIIFWHSTSGTMRFNDDQEFWKLKNNCKLLLQNSQNNPIFVFKPLIKSSISLNTVKYFILYYSCLTLKFSVACSSYILPCKIILHYLRMLPKDYFLGVPK